jgi:hypothetical protein
MEVFFGGGKGGRFNYHATDQILALISITPAATNC